MSAHNGFPLHSPRRRTVHDDEARGTAPVKRIIWSRVPKLWLTAARHRSSENNTDIRAVPLKSDIMFSLAGD